MKQTTPPTKEEKKNTSLNTSQIIEKIYAVCCGYH